MWSYELRHPEPWSSIEPPLPDRGMCGPLATNDGTVTLMLGRLALGLNPPMRTLIGWPIAGSIGMAAG